MPRAGWRGFVFGLKFIIGFGVAGTGVLLEGALYDLTGGFTWLFAMLAAAAALAAATGLLLPGGPRPEAARAAE